MQNKVILIIIGIIITVALSARYAQLHRKMTSQSLSTSKNTSDFLVERQVATKPKGTIEQNWKDGILTVTITDETQSCGGITWTHNYSVNGNIVKVIAKGQGIAMNCPMMPAKFTFMISDLPKADYVIKPDISITYQR